MRKYLIQIWLKIFLPLVAAILLVWVGGCPPRTTSPLDPSVKLNRNELAVAYRHMLDKFELADLDLTTQEEQRTYIIETTLGIVKAGAINPLGILMAIAGAYGIGSAATSTVRTIKKRKPPSTT